MPKLPVVSATQLIRALERMGFEHVGQRGSHNKLRLGDRVAIVPNHAEIKRGTLKKGILNPLDISVEELIRNLQ